MAKQFKGIAGRPVMTDEICKIADLTADPRNAKRHSSPRSSQIRLHRTVGYINRVVIQPNN
jgi:hypothetical protein